MNGKVLTEDEILRCHHSYVRGSSANACGASDFYFARAVEQAVLEKVRAERDFLPPTEREAQAAYWKGKQLAAWEREARKRERAAFEKGFGQGIITAHGGMTMECSRDRFYPLPTCDKCGQEIK